MNNYIPNYNFGFQNNKVNVNSLIKVIKEGIDLLGKNVNNTLFDAYQNYVVATLNIVSANTGRNYLTQYMDVIYPSFRYMTDQNNNYKVKQIILFLLDIVPLL